MCLFKQLYVIKNILKNDKRWLKKATGRQMKHVEEIIGDVQYDFEVSE